MIPLEYQILIAVGLDLLFGDPPGWPHPVQLMAYAAGKAKTATQRLFTNDLVAGIVTVLIILALAGITTWGVIAFCTLIHPLAGDLLSIFILYTCLASRDLILHSAKVVKALRQDDLELARRKVGMMVGRDTASLDEAGVTRAAVESVGENLLDGIISPLLFAFLFGPIGAVCYKAINTLDSTFGYKTTALADFGWASARIDDVANLIPARLTPLFVGLAAAFLRLHPLNCIRITCLDRQKHSSPNSAWAEAAFAGALNIQLGGPTQYRGEITNHPTIGDPKELLTPRHIEHANQLTMVTMLLLVLACVLLLA